MKGLAPICRKLDIDYAPAMMGFDVRGGRSIPLIEGVVVCKEFEQHVLVAFAEDQKCALLGCVSNSDSCFTVRE